MVDYKTLGSRIRAVRLEKKMTQEQLAEAVGVGVTHISHIETGNSIPSLQVMLDRPQNGRPSPGWYMAPQR